MITQIVYWTVFLGWKCVLFLLLKVSCFAFCTNFILFRPLFWLVNLKSFWYFSVSVYDDKASSCVFVFSVLVNIDNICHWCRKVSQEKQESRRKHLLLKARNTINFFFLPFSQQETWAKYCFRLHNLPFQITRIIWRFHQRHLWGRDLTRKVMFFLFYKNGAHQAGHTFCAKWTIVCLHPRYTKGAITWWETPATCGSKLLEVL